MEMNQIKYFLALCGELSFTHAARRCNVSQPSLTNGIKALEQHLGGALFRRKPRIELTELGRAVEPYLQEIAQNAEMARQTAGSLTRPARPEAQLWPNAALNGIAQADYGITQVDY